MINTIEYEIVDIFYDDDVVDFYNTVIHPNAFIYRIDASSNIRSDSIIIYTSNYDKHVANIILSFEIDNCIYHITDIEHNNAYQNLFALNIPSYQMFKTPLMCNHIYDVISIDKNIIHISNHHNLIKNMIIMIGNSHNNYSEINRILDVDTNKIICNTELKYNYSKLHVSVEGEYISITNKISEYTLEIGFDHNINVDSTNLPIVINWNELRPIEMESGDIEYVSEIYNMISRCYIDNHKKYIILQNALPTEYTFSDGDFILLQQNYPKNTEIIYKNDTWYTKLYINSKINSDKVYISSMGGYTMSFQGLSKYNNLYQEYENSDNSSYFYLEKYGPCLDGEYDVCESGNNYIVIKDRYIGNNYSVYDQYNIQKIRLSLIDIGNKQHILKNNTIHLDKIIKQNYTIQYYTTLNKFWLYKTNTPFIEGDDIDTDNIICSFIIKKNDIKITNYKKVVDDDGYFTIIDTNNNAIPTHLNNVKIIFSIN